MTFISNTTPTPNWLYNGEMKKMTETELKVVLLVTRKTLGWFDPMTSKRKEQDYIGQKQFIEFTGQSNRAIATAIQICVKVGWIIARDRNGNLCNTPEKRRRRKIWYQLGSVFTDKISSEHSSQDENLVNKTTQSSEQNDINLVNKVHNTKETLTKETNINITDKSAYGNNLINLLIESLKGFHNIKTLDGTIKENRQYAYLLIKNKLNREITDKNADDNYKANCFRRLLDKMNDFQRTKATSFKYLFYNFNSIIKNK